MLCWGAVVHKTFTENPEWERYRGSTKSDHEERCRFQNKGFIFWFANQSARSCGVQQSAVLRTAWIGRGKEVSNFFVVQTACENSEGIFQAAFLSLSLGCCRGFDLIVWVISDRLFFPTHIEEHVKATITSSQIFRCTQF